MRFWIVLHSVLLVSFFCGAQTPEQSQFDFANGLFGRGFYSDAATEYQTYLKEYPEGAAQEAAFYRLGESYYAQKEYTRALEVFGKLAKQFPQSTFLPRLQLREGVALYRLKKFDLAKEKLLAVAKASSTPQSKGEALYYLGKLYTDTKDWPAAIHAYERLLKEATGSTYATFGRYQLAVVHMAQRQYEPAALMFSAIADDPVVKDPLKMESLYRAAEAYDTLGWHESAIKSYRALTDRFPDSAYARKAGYGLSWSLYRDKKYDDSIAYIDGFMKEHPDSPLASGLNYLKGNCLLKKKQHPEAEKLFRQVMTQSANTPYAQQAQYKLAVSLIEHKAIDEAKKELQELLVVEKPTPLIGDAAFLLGTVQMSAKRYSEAALHFLRVVEQFPKSEFAVESLYKVGECYALSGELAKSATIFESFARKYKKSPLALEAVFNSADAYFQLGDYQQALIRYQHVVSDTTSTAFREEALYRVSISYYNLKNIQESAATFTTLLNDFPSTPYAAEAHYRIGDYQLYEANTPVKAIENFKHVVNTLPQGPFTGRALKGVAVSHFEMKDFEGSVAMFYRVITEYPDLSLRASTYEWVGQQLYEAQQWKETATTFLALLKAIPNFSHSDRIHLKLGEAYLALEQPADALKAYAWVLEHAPQSITAHEAMFKTAQVYEVQNKTDEAVAMYERAATAAMNDTAARSRFRLGQLFEKEKNYEAASKNYLRVAILFLHPTLSPESLFRAGQCFEKDNNADSALKTYRDILKEYPDSEQAPKAQERLATLQDQ